MLVGGVGGTKLISKTKQKAGMATQSTVLTKPNQGSTRRHKDSGETKHGTKPTMLNL